MDFTKIARLIFARRMNEIASWKGNEAKVQRRLLWRMMSHASHTSFGRSNGFDTILADSTADTLPEIYASRVPLRDYEDFREDVMRMIRGEKNILWPGMCRNFAQSSGTTGGRSKYLPITENGLRDNHYLGASYSVALYLRSNPESRMFAGKGLILGGSFATEAPEMRQGVVVGDLSASLIDRINPLANFFRVPDKTTALLPDWQEKLPLIAKKAAAACITNLSGVPSWMLQVLLRVLEIKRTETLRNVWPGLEVFFHGGISFVPYRDEYLKICEGLDMHWSEVYNASEGYFAASDNSGLPGMLMLVDAGVYFEFLPLGASKTIGIDELHTGNIYELVISTINGLWRYRIGDTVRIENLSPLKISIVGRTKSFINAFGEELMEDNAEKAVAEACRKSNASIHNYTVAPVYAHGQEKGRHQWLIEWTKQPVDKKEFALQLDTALRQLNSDYDAKRKHDIFLDLPEIIDITPGTFERWLTTRGNGNLGGQRKVPRLSNTREIADELIKGM